MHRVQFAWTSKSDCSGVRLIDLTRNASQKISTLIVSASYRAFLGQIAWSGCSANCKALGIEIALRIQYVHEFVRSPNSKRENSRHDVENNAIAL